MVGLGIGRRATNYLFFEMWPSLVLGVFVFILILLMGQALRLSELVLVAGVGVTTVVEMLGYLAISLLPVILTMSLLFSVLLTYGRLSQDSEIVALKAIGYSQWTLTVPALLLSAIVAFVSAQTSFQLAPWGNRQFELIVAKLSQTKAGATLKQGTFSEGFFDLVVYANEVDSKTGKIKKVFIYDERSGDLPLTIISKSGEIIQDKKNPGNSIVLQLLDGSIHRKGETHTKINFGTFEVRLSDPTQQQYKAKSALSLTLDEILERLASTELKGEDRRNLEIEYHKRIALAVGCLIFGLLGVGLGTQANRREQKSSGFVTSLVVVIAYWVIYISCEGAARNGQAPVVVAIWAPNLVFLAFALKKLRDIWS